MRGVVSYVLDSNSALGRDGTLVATFVSTAWMVVETMSAAEAVVVVEEEEAVVVLFLVVVLYRRLSFSLPDCRPRFRRRGAMRLDVVVPLVALPCVVFLPM